MFIKKNLSGITHYLKLPRHPLLCMFFLFASKYMVQVCLFSLSDGEEGLDDFTECLSKFTKFNSFRSLATLSYASDIYSGSSIVSRYWKFSHFTLIIVFPYLTIFHTQFDLLLSVCCSTCLIVTEGQIVKLFFSFLQHRIWPGLWFLCHCRGNKENQSNWYVEHYVKGLQTM